MAFTTRTTPPLVQSSFLLLGGGGHKDNLVVKIKPSSFSTTTTRRQLHLQTCSAKFDMSELMGGRGLCNGEQGILQELQKQPPPFSTTQEHEEDHSKSTDIMSLALDGFDKELMGLTGGFPGGEKGLQKFIQQNPPPQKPSSSDQLLQLVATKRPTPPELPILLPGMIAIVKNPNNPYYMYCGIVQRITDGKVGVLFEGGVWDRLITFRAEDLEKRDKGPPGDNPRSVLIEEFFNKASS